MTAPRPGWGILGPGGIAAAFADDLTRTGGRIAAVGSRSPERADAFARRFGIPASHAGYTALVEDPGVDIVYVATPHPFHAEHALLALRAGKHVLVEKPFALNADQAALVLAVARDSGLIALEGMWTRCLPHLAQIRSLLADGAVGRVLTVIADHSQALSRDPSSRLNDPYLGGGALLDLGVYPVSLAYDLFGPAKSVDAAGVLSSQGVDLTYSVIVRHHGGTVSTLTGSSIADGNNRATIIGTQGAIHIEPYWYKPTAFRLCSTDGKTLGRYSEPVEGHGLHLEAREVERLVETGDSTSVLGSAESILGVARLLDAIRHRMGVRYPHETFSR